MSLRRSAAVALAIAIVAGGGVAAAQFSGERVATPTLDASPLPTDPGTPTDSPSPSDPPSPTDAPSPTPSPTPDPEPSPEPEAESAYPVAEVQQTLKDLRYYRGPVDGKEGARTRSAVMAFQKVQGLSADGVVGPNTLAALADPVAPTLKDGPADRIEIDLTRQVLYVVKGGDLVAILPASSGSGDTYRTASGGSARSLTPVGWFEVERRIEGVREAPLGVLYDPLYFYRGWAIHGSNSVPAYPASHGCVRIPRWDATWLQAQVANGIAVHLYGGTHTFTAGSSAPGTDTPAGDTGGQPEPDPTPTPTPTPSPSPSPSPSATNRAPDVRDDSAATTAGRAVEIAVLSNDSDPEGDLDRSTLRILTTPAHGTVAVQSDGTVVYTPATGFTGEDRFTYRVCDGAGACGEATVVVTVEPASP